MSKARVRNQKDQLHLNYPPVFKHNHLCTRKDPIHPMHIKLKGIIEAYNLLSFFANENNSVHDP
jgi:hypothetical protein